MPADASKEKDKSKVHKLSLKGSSRLVAEFVRFSLYLAQRQLTAQFQYSIHTILFQRGVYPAEDFTACASHSLLNYPY